MCSYHNKNETKLKIKYFGVLILEQASENIVQYQPKSIARLLGCAELPTVVQRATP